VVFTSTATDLAAGSGSPGIGKTFLRDLASGRTTLLAPYAGFTPTI
jgi:hypothetical protein